MSDQPLLVFLHVPKTAGTSVRLFLRKMFRPENIVWHGVDGVDLFKTPRAVLNAAAAIGGHVRYRRIERLAVDRPRLYCSVTRDPIDQIVSFYNYVRNRPDHPLHTERPLGEVLRERTKFRRQVTNIQCSYLGMRPTLTSVREMLAAEAALMAPIDRVDALYEMLLDRYEGRTPRRLTRANVGPEGYREAVYDPYVREYVAANCVEDAALHSFVSRHGVYTSDKFARMW